MSLNLVSKKSPIIHEYTTILCIYCTIAIIEHTLSTHKKSYGKTILYGAQ